MTITTITPQSREAWLAGRGQFVGASEAPALLGIHPYISPYELFMRKTGALEAEQSADDIREDSIHLPPMARGNFLEEKAIELARRLRPNWEIVSNPIPGGSIYADLDAGMSSTPDALITLPGGERGTLQIKSVEPSVFREKWKEDGEIMPPLWIVLQAAQDAHLSGATRAFVGAMVIGFNVDFHLIEVPKHVGALAKMHAAVADFWDRVARNDPPPPDYAKDGEVIAQIYSDSADVEIDLSKNNRVAEIIDLRDALKARESDGNEAVKERKILDAELIHALGNCARGRLPDGRIVEAKTVHRKPYAVAASSYRAVKVKEVR